MKRHLLCTVIFISISLISFVNIRAESPADKCRANVKDIPIKSILASASAFANFRNQPGSVSFESKAIFQSAISQEEKLSIPNNFCPKGCSMTRRPSFLFRSSPNKVLINYSDAEYCKSLQKKTNQYPLRYQNDRLKEIADINKWIGELTQGSGQNGADLYKKCNKSCSPRYQYIITKNPSTPGFTIKASVVCGAARDKNDNNYDLEAFFRWTCDVPQDHSHQAH